MRSSAMRFLALNQRGGPATIALASRPGQAIPEGETSRSGEEMPITRPASRAALDLPPLYRLVTLREVGDAFAHATAIAAQEGAGTLVYVGRFDLAEFAVVLEPDEPLRTARRAFYAGCVALADALSVHAPPEKPIELVWPDTVHVDAGLVGGARLAWPAGAPEDEPPDWLVFGAMIRTVAMGEEEPGLHPLTAALDEEGFDDAGSGRLVESFARHLMVATRRLAREGFRRGGEKLPGAAGGRERRAPRHRRQRRSSGAPHGKPRGRAPPSGAGPGRSVLARPEDRGAALVPRTRSSHDIRGKHVCELRVQKRHWN